MNHLTSQFILCFLIFSFSIDSSAKSCGFYFKQGLKQKNLIELLNESYKERPSEYSLMISNLTQGVDGYTLLRPGMTAWIETSLLGSQRILEVKMIERKELTPEAFAQEVNHLALSLIRSAQKLQESSPEAFDSTLILLPRMRTETMREALEDLGFDIKGSQPMLKLIPSDLIIDSFSPSP